MDWPKTVQKQEKQQIKCFHLVDVEFSIILMQISGRHRIQFASKKCFTCSSKYKLEKETQLYEMTTTYLLKSSWSFNSDIAGTRSPTQTGNSSLPVKVCAHTHTLQLHLLIKPKWITDEHESKSRLLHGSWYSCADFRWVLGDWSEWDFHRLSISLWINSYFFNLQLCSCHITFSQRKWDREKKQQPEFLC